MRKFLPKITWLILVSVALTGCPKKDNAPTPNDTVMGLGGSNREDWINESDVSYSEGLSERDSSFYGKDGSGSFNRSRVLASAHFDFDNSAIKPSERAQLTKAADYLKEHPNAHILIEGHCDWYGTTEYNLALGDRRANSAKHYLEQLGVSAQQIETLSKGSLDATKNLSKSDAYVDRRADVILVTKN